MNVIPKKLLGDCRQTMASLPANHFHCSISSPPHWGLRSYLPADHPMKQLEIGSEDTLELYLEHIVEVYREVRRVLRDDGIAWVNIGDRFTSGGRRTYDKSLRSQTSQVTAHRSASVMRPFDPSGLKPKDLCMLPARVAMALQEPYRTPSCVKSEIDRAWLAAMFDGEGCIGVRRFDSFKDGEQKQDGFVVYTVVGNNDIELLEKCIQITGFGNARIKQRADSTDARGIVSRRDNYGWRLDGNKAVDVIRAIYPYLIAKRKQACVAYTLDVLNKAGREARGNNQVPKELQEKRAFCKELINRLNQRELVDLPNWIEEPAPKIEPGWYLRAMIPWLKRNCMPESAKDRPTVATEYVFMLTKTDRYFYDAEAVKMPVSGNTHPRSAAAKSFPAAAQRDENRRRGVNPKAASSTLGSKQNAQWAASHSGEVSARSRRNSDWFLESWQGMLTDDDGQPLAFVVNPKGTTIEHFASYPPKLVEPMLRCSTSDGGCCPKCGANLERVLKDEGPDLEHQKQCGGDAQGQYAGMATKDYEGAKVQNASDVKRRILAGMRVKKTIGFSRGCACQMKAPYPCRVLDPFHGTGTTAEVCTNHGREYTGCEINEDYFKVSDMRDGQGGFALL